MDGAPKASALDLAERARSAGTAARPTTGASGSFRARWHALFAQRDFIASMVHRDFTARYVGSIFGAAWAVLSPLAFILIYTLVFSRLMHGRLPGSGHGTYAYGVFLCTAILPWTLFVETLSRSLTVFLEQRGLLKHQAFPRSALFVVVLLSSMIQFAITFGVFLVFLLLSGQWPGWTLVGVVPLLMLQQAIALGLGVTLGTLNVYFRDTAQAMNVVLQFWFWLTPIVYPADVLPPFALGLLALNPMYGLVEGYRSLVFAHAWPPAALLVSPVVAAIACLLLGRLAYRRLGRGIVDEL